LSFGFMLPQRLACLFNAALPVRLDRRFLFDKPPNSFKL
jgi:hypothetical protein